MYVDGYPIGTWKVGKLGAYFHNRKWRSLPRAEKFVRHWLNNGAKEILLQGWQGENLVYDQEFEPIGMKLVVGKI